MKTNSKKKYIEKSVIEKGLQKLPIRKLSKETGFCKKKARKIEAKKFIVSFLLTVWSPGINSYRKWAFKHGLLINNTVSKQAISKRITKEFVELLKGILKETMAKNLSGKKKEQIPEKLKQFKRILIEDSTNMQLDDRMKKEYPGNRIKGKDYAIMKVQVLYEAIHKKFINFEITNFRKNDQSYAEKIIEIVKPKDLIIRDLGYYITRVFKKLTEMKVSFVSRLRQGTYVYQEEEKPIDLGKMLRKRGSLDIEVFLGKESRTPVRLIAIPVEPEVAAIKRMKAKVAARRYNIRKECLFLMGWNLLITNIPKDQMESAQIAQLYALRWRIEIIFKSWKSGMKIHNVPSDANKIRIEAHIYCMLIFIMLFQVNYYIYYSCKKSKLNISERTKNISLLSFTEFIVSNINIIVNKYCPINPSFYKLKRFIEYYCTYGSRNDRGNYNQLLLSLS